MLVEGARPEANLERACAFVRDAALKGCQVVVLPECLDLGWTDPCARQLAQPIPGPHSQRLAQAAIEGGVFLVGGLVERAGELLYNAAVLIDPGDDDPARFWRHLIAAVDARLPGTRSRAEASLAAESGSPERVATSLINEIADAGAGVTLVLDDYHHVADGRVHASVAFLIEHRPDALHIVIASRMDPPLGLARLRAGGHLGELRAADLRFTTRLRVRRGLRHLAYRAADPASAHSL